MFCNTIRRYIRAEDFRHFAVDEMNEYYKMTAVKESDAFVGKLLKRLNLNGCNYYCNSFRTC